MAARTGEQFLKGLGKPRAVWVDGERIADVVDHPKLAGAAHALAEVFDLQHAEAAICLTPDAESGEPVAVSHMIPRSREDLARRMEETKKAISEATEAVHRTRLEEFLHQLTTLGQVIVPA